MYVFMSHCLWRSFVIIMSFLSRGGFQITKTIEHYIKYDYFNFKS